MRTACGDSFTTNASTLGECPEPCWCALAMLMNCTCGFYSDPNRRKAGHHLTDCKKIQENQ